MNEIIKLSRKFVILGFFVFALGFFLYADLGGERAGASACCSDCDASFAQCMQETNGDFWFCVNETFPCYNHCDPDC